MDKHRDASARVCDIGVSGTLLPVTAITRPTHLAQHLAYDELWLGVDTFVRDHDVMYGFAYHLSHDTARTCIAMSQVRGTMGALFAHFA